MQPLIEVQTDKKATKTIPCTYPGCEVKLVVNTFYAPAKGKCSQHKGRSDIANAKMVAAGRMIEQDVDAPPPPPNGALANMLCPVCEKPLTIQTLEDSLGYVVFGCSDSRCLCSVKIKPRWSHVPIGRISTIFAGLVKQINDEANRWKAINAVN